MDTERKANDPTLVCTCNDLYIEDIQESIDIWRRGVLRDICRTRTATTLRRMPQCHVEALGKRDTIKNARLRSDLAGHCAARTAQTGRYGTVTIKQPVAGCATEAIRIGYNHIPGSVTARTTGFFT